MIFTLYKSSYSVRSSRYSRIATAPSVWYFTLYSQRTVRTSTEANLSVSLVQTICTSQLSHGFYSAWDSTALVLYVLPWAPPLYSPRAVQFPYTVKTMRQLLHVYMYVYTSENTLITTGMPSSEICDSERLHTKHSIHVYIYVMHTMKSLYI